VPVYVNLGTAYLEQGRIDEGIQVLRKACRLDPYSAIAHRRLAYAYSKLERYGAAMEELEVALKINPEDYECRNSIAAILMIFFLKEPAKDDLRERAISHWHMSLESNPNQENIRRLIKKWGKYKPRPTPAPAPPPEPETSPAGEREKTPPAEEEADVPPEAPVDAAPEEKKVEEAPAEVDNE